MENGILNQKEIELGSSLIAKFDDLNQNKR